MSNLSGVLSRDFELMLEPGVYLMPLPRPESGRGAVLYAPIANTILPLTDAQAELLSENAGDPSVIGLFLDALLGKERSGLSREPGAMDAYRPTSVALMMTTTCQLRCTYCYAEAGSTPSQHLAKEASFAAIDFISQNAVSLGKPSIVVHFHGAGEPTLRWDHIWECLDYARSAASRNGLSLRTVITTNFCLPPDRAILLAERIDRLIVSCDGPPDVMNENRPMLHDDSGAVLEAALQAVSRAGLADKLRVRATMTRKTQGRLPEFVRYFSALGMKHLYLVSVSGTGRGARHESVDVEVFLASWRSAVRVAHEQGLTLDHPVLDLDQLRPEGFACGINGSNFALMPDGSVSVCYEAVVPGSQQAKAFQIGGYSPENRTFQTSLPLINHIRSEYHVSRRQVCDTCFCRLTCAGRCAAREMSPTGAPRDMAMTDGCDITRSLTAEIIQALAYEET